jgi:transposase
VLTRQEKERLVIELYNQGKTIREISKKCHISFRDIGALVRKASGEKEESQDKEQSLLSPSSQAYKLFSEGRTLIEVAIALNLTESETTKYYEEYLNLKQMYDLQMVYEELGGDIVHFLELYRLSKKERMNPQHIVNLLRIVNNDLPASERRYYRLKKDLLLLELEKQKSEQIGSQVGFLAKLAGDYKQRIKELHRKKIALENLMNNGQYEKVRQVAEKEVNNSLSPRRDLLKLAIVSVLESLRQNPDKYNFLINTNQYYGGQYGASQSYIDAYRTMILDESHKLFELIARDLTSEIVNEPTLTIPS